MRPAASFSDGFRFEMGMSAEGLFFDPALVATERFTDEFVILEGAAQLVMTLGFAMTLGVLF